MKWQPSLSVIVQKMFFSVSLLQKRTYIPWVNALINCLEGKVRIRKSNSESSNNLRIVAASEGHWGNQLDFSLLRLGGYKLGPELSSWTVKRHQMRVEGKQKMRMKKLISED